MKTMTCKQMGGPCDQAFHGATADAVIMAAEKHIRDSVAGGDEAHKPALEMMDAMRKDPKSGMAWYMKTQADFAALPED